MLLTPVLHLFFTIKTLGFLLLFSVFFFFRRQPPPDVRSTIGDYFRRTGWEIRQNKPVPGMKPPTGEHMETLLRFSVRRLILLI